MSDERSVSRPVWHRAIVANKHRDLLVVREDGKIEMYLRRGLLGWLDAITLVIYLHRAASR